MKKFAVPIILTVIFGWLALWFTQTYQWFPMQASAEAVPVDGMILLSFEILAVVAALVMVFFVYALVVFRRRPGDTADGPHFHSHNGLEIAWTIVPLIIVMGMWWHGVQVADSMGLLRELPSDAQALQINVTGQQWAWSFEYPKQAGVPESFSSDRLVLPVDRTAVFSISSPDVMHSFWIPEMRMKMDAIPGRVNKMRLTPNKAGEYKVRCAELCGTDHAYMESPVQVLAAEGFTKFVADNDISKLSPEERGEKWAKTYGCVGCHSIDGNKMAGPTWKDLYGHEVELDGGTKVKADEAYLKTSILDPNSQIVLGFKPNVMPKTFQDRFTKDNAGKSFDEVDDLIAFIKSAKVDTQP